MSASRFAVIGVGGAGGYFGARLVEAGHEVAFIARGDHLAAIRKDGLRVESVCGDVVVRPSIATDDPIDIGKVDFVILGVKAWQVPEAARMAAPLIGASTVVLPLQNGIEASQQIAEALGQEHALGGTSRIISFTVGAGHIRHTGAEPRIEMGELDGSRTKRLMSLCEAFERAKGVEITVSGDIVAAMWAKFMFIASWAGVGAVVRAPIGIVRTVSETRRLLEGAAREIDSVARAHHVRLSDTAVADTMAYVDSLPAHGTASMQRDIADGKPSELSNLTGAVARLGAKVGVPTPINEFLYDVLLPLERRARGELRF